MPWKKILRESITTAEELPRRLKVDRPALTEVIKTYPMRINPYFLSLIDSADGPLGRQAIPLPVELEDTVCPPDPLNEENLSPVPNLVHKYPDRALFLVSSHCAVNCRFCTRKRKVGTPDFKINQETIAMGLEYLAGTPAIRDVLISGGDPLLLDDDHLEELLRRIREIPSVEIIRIGSRAPCTLPMRITTNLAKLLKKFHPVYLNTHFNHPDELTGAAAGACERLADAGIPLGCQTVLLRGINDEPGIITRLMRGLLRIRVKPYYMFQGDMTRGTNHFRTSINRGLAIMDALNGRISGLAVPRFAVDLPGGFGKVPLLPDYLIQPGRQTILKNYQGRLCTYLDPPD